MTLPRDYLSVQTRMTDKGDEALFTTDFTKANAIETCPRWGLVRYHEHKRMPGEARSTALEMGTAAHQAYACVRLFQLHEYAEKTYANWDKRLLHKTGVRLFGESRWEKIYEWFTITEDQRRRVSSACNYVLNTSGYYDDPDDKRRTLSNLEQSIQLYIDNQVLDKDIPYVNVEIGFVGIEVPFQFVVEYEYETMLPGALTYPVRFCGK